MARTPHTSPSFQPLLDAAVADELTEAQSQQIYQLGPEAVTLVAIAMAQQISRLRDEQAQTQRRIADL